MEKEPETEKTTKKEMQEIQDSQASLVNALESIRGLLEQSESKLSAARESLSATRPKAGTPPLPQSKQEQEEPIVPVLDEIVIPGQADSTHDETDDTDSGILPLFNDLQYDAQVEIPVVLEEVVVPVEEEPADISETCREELIEAIRTVREELDDQLNYMMAKSMAELEIELRKVIDEKLNALTELIEKK